MHAVGRGAGGGVAACSAAGDERLVIDSLDAALVSPGVPTGLPNVRRPPDTAQGVAFNLYNNLWGTNYVM